jgi:hypothetical protein
MVSPGSGAGNEAAADAVIKGLIPGLLKAMSSYPPESKKFMAVHKALGALIPNFGRENDQSMVPAALQQMMMAARAGGPMKGAAPPGLAPAPPPGPPGGAEPPGAAGAMAA